VAAALGPLAVAAVARRRRPSARPPTAHSPGIASNRSVRRTLSSAACAAKYASSNADIPTTGDQCSLCSARNAKSAFQPSLPTNGSMYLGTFVVLSSHSYSSMHPIFSSDSQAASRS